MDDQTNVSVTAASVTVSAVETSSSSVQPPSPPRRSNGNGHNGNWGKKFGSAIVITIIILAIYYVGIWAKMCATTAWLWTLGLLILLCVYLGFQISGRPLGILVNNRNLMSLSRFQMVAWTIVILSGFLTIAFRRILAGVAAPLDIGLDEHLWAIMGISTASLVSTPLILQNKASKAPGDKALDSAATALQASGSTDETKDSIDANRVGTLYVNPTIEDARFTDLFEGDEIGNTAYVDIAKVQMFLFTMITIVAYCSAIYHLLWNLCPSGSANLDFAKLGMPVLSSGMIGLLGISHAGYLGSKTADHTAPPQS